MNVKDSVSYWHLKIIKHSFGVVIVNMFIAFA